MDVAQGEPSAIIALVVFGVWGIFLLIGLASVVLWVWALVDFVRREFPRDNDKLIWILIIVLAHWLGALIYLIVGRPKGWLPGERPPTPV